MKYRSVQLLRAVVCIAILLIHATDLMLTDKYSVVKYLAVKAHISVDILFAVSGFVINMTYRKFKAHKDMRGFLLARAIRIFPAFWFFLSFWLLFNVCNVSYSASYLLGSYFLVPANTTICTVQSWTLSYELYFYLLVALLIISKKFVYLLYALALLILVSITSAAFFNNFFPEKAFWSLNLMDFLLGMAAFEYHKKVPAKTAKLLVLPAIIVALLPSYGTQFAAFFQVTIPAFIIVLGVTAAEVKGMLKVPQSIVRIGDSSYILYLLNLGPFYLFQMYFPGRNVLNNFLLGLIVILLIRLSVLIYIYMEKPVLRFLKRYLLLKYEKVPEKI